MNVLSEEKGNIKFVIWTVTATLPVNVSDIFSFRGREYRLELTVEDKYGSNLHFKKNEEERQSPVIITVLPPINFEGNSAKEMPITSAYQNIWSYSTHNLLNCSLTFRVIMHGESSNSEYFEYLFYFFSF